MALPANQLAPVLQNITVDAAGNQFTHESTAAEQTQGVLKLASDAVTAGGGSGCAIASPQSA